MNKPYGFVGIITVVAVLVSGGIFWLVSSTNFFTMTFAPAIYSAYGVNDIRVERETLGNVPVSAVHFSVDAGAQGSSRVDPGAFNRIETDIKNSLKDNNYLYTVDGTGEGFSYRFESVSARDYQEDVFSDSYNEFIRLLSTSDETRQIDYASTISDEGSRVFTLEATDLADEEYRDSNLKLGWENLLNSVTVKTDTTHNVTFNYGEGLTINGRFFNVEDRDKLTEIPENLLNTWVNVNQNAERYGISHITINIPSNPESSLTTVSVTLDESIEDKSGTVTNFLNTAKDNPDLVIPDSYTISFIGEGDSTPFQIVEPTNRSE